MPWMGLEPPTFTLTDRHSKREGVANLVQWLACLPFSLKVVGSGLIHSLL